VDAFGHVLSCQALNVTASQGPAVGRAYPVSIDPGQRDWMFEPVSGRGEGWNGLTGGKILPAHDYHNEGKRWCGLLSGLVLFRLVVLPLQPGVVGPYPVRGV
jgi:hypothetical protein